MPQELKPPYSGGLVAPDIFARQPELGVLVASVAHLWSIIEMHLADLVVHIAGQHALTIFLSTVSLDMKLSALSAVARQSLPTALYEEFRDHVQPDIRRRAKERNKIVHARWAENGEFPDGIIMLPHFGDLSNATKFVELYRAPDLVEILNRIAFLESAVRDFGHRVYLLKAEEERVRLKKARESVGGPS